MGKFEGTSLILECECGVINYLDPFTFWNYSGNVKCAGCDAVFAVSLKNGIKTKDPAKTDSKDFVLPGFAETPDWKPITDPSKVNKPPQAREDFQGKPIPITKSVRGKKVSGAPLTADDLEGGVPKFLNE